MGTNVDWWKREITISVNPSIFFYQIFKSSLQHRVDQFVSWTTQCSEWSKPQYIKTQHSFQESSWTLWVIIRKLSTPKIISQTYSFTSFLLASPPIITWPTCNPAPTMNPLQATGNRHRTRETMSTSAECSCRSCRCLSLLSSSVMSCTPCSRAHRQQIDNEIHDHMTTNGAHHVHAIYVLLLLWCTTVSCKSLVICRILRNSIWPMRTSTSHTTSAMGDSSWSGWTFQSPAPDKQLASHSISVTNPSLSYPSLPLYYSKFLFTCWPSCTARVEGFMIKFVHHKTVRFHD